MNDDFLTEAECIDDAGEYYANKDFEEKERAQEGALVSSEVKQQEESSLAIIHAKELVIKDNTSFEAAGNWLVDLKTYYKRVEEYWKPLKDSAYKAWKAVTAKERAILDPLSTAETTVKGKMAAYQMEQKAKAEAIRAEAERLKREETERLLKKAQEKEAAGDAFGADITLAQAEVIESSAPVAEIQHAKTQGISNRKVWKARITDEAKVPVSVAGVVFRPVDESALNKFAKLTDGKTPIPGVEFYQDIVMSVRGR